MLGTGFPRADAENDFLRARRHQFLAALTNRLRDRCFRPAAGRVRSRWERLALAQRRGEAIPPIEVYRVGHRHFVSDGHHRVSIAAATGQQLIDAYVTQVLTTVPPQTQTARPPHCWR
jgi:hypothetical protein